MLNLFHGHKCEHIPNCLIFSSSDQEIEYYASDLDHISWFNGDLILNLTGRPLGKHATNFWEIEDLSEHFYYMPEEYVLGWEDGDAPPVKPTFWAAFERYCKDNEYKEVCIHCIAGHGRTGTALAALLIANRQFNAIDAINYVRTEYCEDAIETKLQVDYLFEMDKELNDNEHIDYDYSQI